MSQWRYLNISPFETSFIFCLQSFRLFFFSISQLFTSGRQSIEASVAVHPTNILGWFPLGLTGLISLQILKNLLQHLNSKALILQGSAFFMVQLSHPYMTTAKTIALTIWTCVSKLLPLLFNTLSYFVISFLPRSKHLLILWLLVTIHSDFAAQENKICHCFHFFSFYLPYSDGTRCQNLVFFNVEFQPTFFTLLFHLIKRLFSSFSPSDSKIVSSSYMRSFTLLPLVNSSLCFTQPGISHDVLCI